MRVLHRSGHRPRGLARMACRAALALGLAASAVAGSTAAQARIIPIRGLAAAVAWGNNTLGQLGDGTTTTPGPLQYVAVSGLTGGVAQVSAGFYHSLALTTGGSVWAWGDNTVGELGDDTTVNSSIPVQVSGLSGITQVSAGGSGSLALSSDGTVWAWGWNQFGEVGDGTTVNRLTPFQVPGLSGITQVAAGDGFNLALRSDGTVWAWGLNNHGELGDGTFTDSSVPVQVQGLSQVTRIAAGESFSMAVRTKGFITFQSSVWTWGSNFSGQLGDGTLTDRDTPEEVSGIGVQSISGIAAAAGGSFAMVLGSDGSVWEWGDNATDQLGEDTGPESQTTPVEAIGQSTITQIAASANDALALHSDGTVWQWGNSSFNFSTGFVNSTTPQQISGLTDVTQISGGTLHALAVRTAQLIFRTSAHT
jgi:alpha-tubulin suppressor-like RCC1 family protein